MRACQVCNGTITEKEFSVNGVNVRGRSRHKVCPPAAAAAPAKPRIPYPDRLDARRGLHRSLSELDKVTRAAMDLVTEQWVENIDLDALVDTLTARFAMVLSELRTESHTARLKSR